MSLIPDELLLEVGRVAALRGTLRHQVLCSIGALLATRLDEQGLGQVLAARQEIPALVAALLTLSRVRGVSRDAIATLEKIASAHVADFDAAAVVANGSWTLLGGSDPMTSTFGVFEETVEYKGALTPRWKKTRVQDLHDLADRLETVSEQLQELGWAFIRAGIGRDVSGHRPPKKLPR